MRAIFSLMEIILSPKWRRIQDLKVSQLQRENDHWKYTKHGSRNFCGGLADLRRQENKVVQQFVCPTAGDHCHVRLLDLYVSKLGQREGCLLLHSTA